MNPELARLAIQFLARVDLKGSEAPAMTAVMQALDALAAQPQQQAQPQPPTRLREVTDAAE